MTELLPELLPYLGGLLVLIFASAFFSGSEVAMFSLRRVDREQLLRSESARDKRIMAMLSRPGRLIATILVGNESVNVAVSVVMAALCRKFFEGTEVELAVLAVVLALPLLLLVGEITPKTIAIKAPVGWVRKAASPLWLFHVLVTPIRFVVRFITDLVMIPFGGKTKRGSQDLSEKEFMALVDAGSAGGEVEPHERRLIRRVFQFGDKKVQDAMLGREKVFALSYDLPRSRLLAEVAKRGFSRVPIYRKSLDNVQGILYAKDVVIQTTKPGNAWRLSDILHRPLFVVGTMPLEQLFRVFKRRRTHIALVVNEYGKVSGIVTMEDLLEELFGEIRDEREVQKLATPARVSTAESPSKPGADT